MRSTRRLSRPQRYAVASVVAFAVHWSLARALPARPPVDPETKPALVWLEAVPTGVMTGIVAEVATGAKMLLTHPPAASRGRVTRGRNVPRLVMPSDALKAASSSSVLDAVTLQGERELAGPMPKAHDAGPLQASITGDTAAALRGESGLAAEGPAAMPVFDPSGGHEVMHGPILRAATGCAGYFPADAPSGHGVVEIDVTVDAGGHARASHVLNEQPWGQGFGLAARGCVRTLSFAPAVDRSGAAVSGHAKLRLRFDRPFTT